MIKFSAVGGQSLSDVCINTYGSMDYFFKLLQDNAIENPNALPASNGQFSWDNSLATDAQNQRTIVTNNLKFATASSGNMNTYYIVSADGYIPANPTNSGSAVIPSNSSNTMYQKTSATTYTAESDGLTVIAVAGLPGKDILQIERNIEPLKPSEFSWTTSTGTLTLSNPLLTGETLFILYTEMIIL